MALNCVLEEASKIISNGIVHPFIESIEKPLQNLALGDEDNVYLIEEELNTVILNMLESKISEVLNLIIVQEEVNLTKELKTVFAPQDVKSNLIVFFENLQVADLFLELFEMERNKSIMDKQDFYLYFADISFNNNKYPIFYIPFALIREKDNLQVEFDSQVYVNKKVLEFIVQEHNVLKGTKGSLKTISERIIYLSQHQDDLLQMLNNILNEISHFFELEGGVDLSSNSDSIARGATTRVSNSSYICLFDKSDEALVNDYEDILKETNQEDGILASMFNKLIEDFIQRNPESCSREVEDEWDSTEIPDKLVYPSPIPLNSEQRQIVSAIQKKNCNYIVVS